MVLGYFADAAFAIYFLHIFFLDLAAGALWSLFHLPQWQPVSVYLAGVVMLGFCVGMSMVVVRSSRAVFGKRSRMLFGY